MVEEESKSKAKAIDSLSKTLSQTLKKLTTLQSRESTRNAIKRNLLLHKLTVKYRESRDDESSETRSSHSGGIPSPEAQEISERLATLERKFRKQRDQIYDLEKENDSLRDKRGHHQRLIKSFDKLKDRLKKIKKENAMIQSYW